MSTLDIDGHCIRLPRRRGALGPWLFVMCTVVPRWALADDASANPEQVAAARDLAIQGHQLAEAGDCAHAIDPLTRAEALYHAPTTAEWLGACQIAVGKIVAGTETLRRIVHEALPPNAPRAFVDAQARAQMELTQAKGRIARLKIHVDRPPSATLTLKIDDAVVPTPLLDTDRPSDPGTHAVHVAAPGFKAIDTNVTLQEGERREVTLKLEVDPNAASAPPPSPETTGSSSTSPASANTSTSSASPEQTAPASHGSRTLAFVAIGVGAAGVAVGAVFGALALGTKSTLDHDECPTPAHCVPSAQKDIDALSSQSTISTVGFAVGLVGLGAGLTLLLTSGGSSSSHAATSGTGVAVSPWFGGSAAGLKGTF